MKNSNVDETQKIPYFVHYYSRIISNMCDKHISKQCFTTLYFVTFPRHLLHLWWKKWVTSHFVFNEKIKNYYLIWQGICIINICWTELLSFLSFHHKYLSTERHACVSLTNKDTTTTIWPCCITNTSTAFSRIIMDMITNPRFHTSML